MSFQDFNADENADFGIGVGLPFSAANFNGPQPTIRQNLDVPGVVSPVASVIVVGAASGLAIGANAERRGIIFVNPGQTTVWVVPSNIPAVAGAGVPVPSGQQVSFINDDNLVRYNCGWNAISQAGGAPLTILELV